MEQKTWSYGFPKDFASIQIIASLHLKNSSLASKTDLCYPFSFFSVLWQNHHQWHQIVLAKRHKKDRTNREPQKMSRSDHKICNTKTMFFLSSCSVRTLHFAVRTLVLEKGDNHIFKRRSLLDPALICCKLTSNSEGVCSRVGILHLHENSWCPGTEFCWFWRLQPDLFFIHCWFISYCIRSLKY